MEKTYAEPISGANTTVTGRLWEWLARLPATVAALTCTGVGIFYNAEFARQFGEAAVALAVASDVLKALAGPTLMAAVHSRQWGRGIAALAVLVVSLAVSLIAAFGSAQNRREEATDDRAAAIRAFDDADAKKKRLEAELTALGLPRPVSVIQAEVEAFKIDMNVWRRSNKCAEISLEDTKKACAPILALYKERGAAARKVEIEDELEKLSPLLKKGRPEHADPQAAAISAVTGLDETTIRRCISLLIVATIEVGAIGGTIITAKPSPPRIPVPANTNMPAIPGIEEGQNTGKSDTKRSRRGRKADQRIMDFSEEYFQRNGRYPSGSQIKAEFPELPTSTAYDYAARCRHVA